MIFVDLRRRSLALSLWLPHCMYKWSKESYGGGGQPSGRKILVDGHAARRWQSGKVVPEESGVDRVDAYELTLLAGLVGVVDGGVDVAMQRIVEVVPALEAGKKGQAVLGLLRQLALACCQLPQLFQRVAAQVDVVLGTDLGDILEILNQLVAGMRHLLSSDGEEAF